MNVIARISLRNLIRQKRRNVLLGTAIAIGMMILVMANSFAHGISDTLFNRIVVFVAGHVSINFSKNGDLYTAVFHDGARIKQVVKETAPEATSVQEAIGVFARVVGNGKSDNLILVGVDLEAKVSPEELKATMDNFQMVAGKFEDLSRTDIENPCIIAEGKAKTINAKLGDILRARYQDINGSNQTARFTVAGIFKPANSFMEAPLFVSTKYLKPALGYGPNDIAALYINLKDPKKDAVRIADAIHKRLNSGLASAYGSLAFNGKTAEGLALAFTSDSASRSVLRDSLKLSAGHPDSAFGRETAVVGSVLANEIGIKPGDTCNFTYLSKDSVKSGSMKIIVRGIAAPGQQYDRTILVNDREFFRSFYQAWPKTIKDSTLLPTDKAIGYKILGKEWTLMERTRTSDEYQKQFKEIGKKKLRSIVVAVASMYEVASAVIKLEYALNLITLACVLILFMIILIGVVNTLRMTIRERTREIGTVRAIGMQKKDVRNSFILETLFLAIFSCTAGTIAAIIVMNLLTLITFNMQDNQLSMLLENGHLNFVTSPLAIAGNFVLIQIIAVLTAYFPAKKAANLSAAAALRHYE
ncbi:MAG: ABC transporter permease [Fibrobacteres bacterium]|nr:ABC transporter permease [Fibrobacterota bacterium]